MHWRWSQADHQSLLRAPRLLRPRSTPVFRRASCLATEVREAERASIQDGVQPVWYVSYVAEPIVPIALNLDLATSRIERLTISRVMEPAFANLPVEQPPKGQKANYTDPENLSALTASFISVATLLLVIIVALRAYVKSRLRTALTPEDCKYSQPQALCISSKTTDVCFLATVDNPYMTHCRRLEQAHMCLGRFFGVRRRQSRR